MFLIETDLFTYITIKYTNKYETDAHFCFLTENVTKYKFLLSNVFLITTYCWQFHFIWNEFHRENNYKNNGLVICIC